MRHREKHLTIHSYDWTEDYSPSIYDTCVLVANKGLETEVSPGTETLKATGRITASRVDVTQGVSETIMEQFGITAGTPNVISATAGWGRSGTIAWHWSLEDDSSRIDKAPTPIDGSFEVKMLPFKVHSESHEHTTQSTDGCVPCPKCKNPLADEDDHVQGYCDPNAAVPGCGEKVYECDPIVAAREYELHKVRICSVRVLKYYKNKWNYKFGPCGVEYRRCMKKNNDLASHEASDSTPIAGLSSSDDFYSAKAGDVHEANLVADGPYSQVYWYVRAPGETGYGTEVEIDNGDGSASEASLSYTFPSDAPGEVHDHGVHLPLGSVGL